MKKNKNLKVLVFLMITLAGILMCNIWMTMQMHKMTEECNIMIASFIGSVKEEYPDIKEEEWISFLNDREGYEKGSQLLSRYGFFQDSVGSVRMQELQRKLSVGMNIIWVLLCLGIFCAVMAYYRKRQKKLDQLAVYIQKVEQGHYVLDMPDNAEDELSVLKNELYKVTVMLKESAELALHQKRALADSVSDISHQLKTPLTSVTILLDNLLDSSYMEEGTRKRFLQEISRQLTNVNWLVAVLLKLSRLDAGVVEFVNRPFSLDELLDEVSGKLEIMAEWKQIGIERKGTKGIWLTGDFRWIGEAVMNIVKNAIEHSPVESEVAILTEENAVYTLITVRDNGPGLTIEEQKHVFERFYRSGKAEENSIGIGLSLAKAIIEQQNGYLTVSSAPGEGTKFMIKFLK